MNHTLVYYQHEVNGCCFNIHTTKTEAGTRLVPMLGHADISTTMNIYADVTKELKKSEFEDLCLVVFMLI